MRYIYIVIVLFASSGITAQHYHLADSSFTANGEITVAKLAGDSLVSSFLITIMKEVKPHYHRHHSEHVYVLKGDGILSIGDKKLVIKPGSLVFIPSETVHGVVVTSAEPLVVLSIQAPEFDGSDRVMVPE